MDLLKPHEIDYLRRDKYVKIEDNFLVQTQPVLQVSVTRPGNPGFLCKPHDRKQVQGDGAPLDPLMKAKWTYSQKNL